MSLFTFLSTPALIAISSQMRLCIGRSAWNGKQSNQWDGSIENVKLWARVLNEARPAIRKPFPLLMLKQDELAKEADELNTPEVAGYGKLRYA
jgi:hypothetical protein